MGSFYACQQEQPHAPLILAPKGAEESKTAALPSVGRIIDRNVRSYRPQSKALKAAGLGEAGADDVALAPQTAHRQVEFLV